MLGKLHLASFLLLAAPLAAQQIDDPANLMGERVSPPALADTLPINHGAPALEQLMRKLRTRASMMLIVAHPDDEDSGLLTLESRGKGARVAMLTLTRGEGGQNLMTADFNDALGLIRTQELLAEDRYTGTDQFFGTEVDFGFSKTKEESFEKWTHDRVLYDAVRSVRLYRPLVLASVFIGGVTDGHGQHQVSGEIAQEVFLAAADPRVFPEMGLPPWAPLRVYARVPFAPITEKGMFDYATGKFLPPHFHNYVTGADSTTPPQATVTIHEGEVPNIPAFEGKSYVQWARQGLALQKTQIGANFRIPPAGRVDVGYTLYGSRTHCIVTESRSTPKPGAPCLDSETWASAKPVALPAKPQSSSEDQDLFTGINTSLPSIADLAPDAPPSVRSALVAIDAKIAEAQRLYDPSHIERTAPPLRDALRALDTLIASAKGFTFSEDQQFNLLHEVRIKRVQCNEAVVLALGLTMTATPASGLVSVILPLHPVNPHLRSLLHLSNPKDDELQLNEFDPYANIENDGVLPRSGPTLSDETPSGPLQSVTLTFDQPMDENLNSIHHWTKPYFSRPDAEQPFYNIAEPALRNAPQTPPPFTPGFWLLSGKTALYLDQVEAVEAEPAVLVPPVSVSVSPSSGIVSASGGKLSLHVAISTASQTPVDGSLSLKLPDGWMASPAHSDFRLTARSMATFDFQVSSSNLSKSSAYRLSAVARVDGSDYTEGYRPIGYPGLTATNFYTPATFRVVPVDVATAPNLRIAYLPGTGDDVPQYLPSLSVTPTILNAKDLTLANLNHYDAILLGVRAYSAHPELSGTGSDPLKAFAEAGGIVIAQYNSGGFDPASAPYPYTLPGDSAHNVVDEDQPVQLLAPADPLLTWPNRITSVDFDHWIEERGHGFATDWAPQYTPLLETHDPDQDPQRGGLLVAKAGKGAYIYCAFALYRQLPEGVPGAYRLLANLLSYAKNPKR